MQKILLITHPEVIIDAARPIDEWLLSKVGIERAHGLLKQSFWKEVDVIYSSTEPKARMVAAIAGAHFRLRLVLKECLVEIDRSSTGLLPFDEYMETVKCFYEKPAENVCGWESAFDATQRITNCVKSITANPKIKTAAIVGHGATLTLLLCKILGLPPSFEMDPGKVGCFAEVDWENQQIITLWEEY